jgi:hypothetical protein
MHIPASTITSAISMIRNVHSIMLLLAFVFSAVQVSTVAGFESSSVQHRA